jgi:hypothetical protein
MLKDKSPHSYKWSDTREVYTLNIAHDNQMSGYIHPGETTRKQPILMDKSVLNSI